MAEMTESATIKLAAIQEIITLRGRVAEQQREIAALQETIQAYDAELVQAGIEHMGPPGVRDLAQLAEDRLNVIRVRSLSIAAQAAENEVLREELDGCYDRIAALTPRYA